jgi:iron-sulfur cluster assembly protein
MVTQQIQSDLITITPAAAQAVIELLEKRHLTGYALRLFVSGGGCSGLQYGMALENNIRETDWFTEMHGVKIVVDEISLDYLRGSSIDYVDTLMGGGFKIENPNAIASCGCGHSFRTKETADAYGASGSGCNC